MLELQNLKQLQTPPRTVASLSSEYLPLAQIGIFIIRKIGIDFRQIGEPLVQSRCNVGRHAAMPANHARRPRLCRRPALAPIELGFLKPFLSSRIAMQNRTALRIAQYLARMK